MNLRVLGLSVAAAVAGGVFAWAVFMALDGGDGEGEAGIPLEDPRTGGVLAFVPQTLERLRTLGPEGIYDVMDFAVKDACTPEEFAEAMAGEPAPSAFREVVAIKYQDDGSADVTIRLIGQPEDTETIWTLTFLPNNLPKILEMPGMEECAPA